MLADTACLGALAGALVVGGVVLAPGSTAQTCGPGFVPNPYNSQCLAPVITPVINGVPCVASKLALCSSFVQNQQPPRVPSSSAS
ncbi:MAG: hypothetical protein NTY24_06530 [Mycobacterium sp.]|nr:hypothetical protein [Mycobacterium sp.]